MPDLYLELLKDTLTNKIYAKYEYTDLLRSDGRMRKVLGHFFAGQLWLLRHLFPTYHKFLSGRPLISRQCDWSKRQLGKDWPPYAYTMVGRKRLDNLETCLDVIRENSIPGDFIETGVWRGGACIFIAGYMKFHGLTDRKLWALDSFDGLPKPNSEYPADNGDIHHTFSQVAVDLETVKSNFQAFGLLEPYVHFVQGHFANTVRVLPVTQIALLRLDGDMYESTIVVLNNLYKNVSPGGIVVIDDYTLPNCRQAVTDFRTKHNISSPLLPIDDDSVYWVKLGEIFSPKSPNQ